MADNHEHDDDDIPPDFFTILSTLLSKTKAPMLKKQNKDNSGSSKSSSNALGKSKLNLSVDVTYPRDGPTIRPNTVRKISLSTGNFKVAPKRSNSPPNDNMMALLVSLNRQTIKKEQQSKVQPKCDLITKNISAAKDEMNKALEKQMVDQEKSFQEKVKFVDTLKTICSQYQDSIKHVVGKENGDK